MKKRFVLPIWLVLVALLASCVSPLPTGAPPQPTEAAPLTATPQTPSNTPAPSDIPTENALTPEPTAAADDDWARIQREGTLVIGTSADYPPFSFYNSLGELDGFDVALIRDLARRLDVNVQLYDFAFEGLIGAVYLGQIDAALAAMSVAPEREALIDFTNLYFMGVDGILARASSGVAAITAPRQMSGYRVAVQRETVYQDWVQRNLVDTGIVASDKYFVYDKPENAVRDMRENRVDLVIMDLAPAASFTSQDVRLVGKGLATQEFAIGTRKGSTLTAQLNRVLDEARADGTIDQLAALYLNVDTQIVAPPTPTPRPTDAPPACVYGMQFVRDLNYDDADMTNPPLLNPGSNFQKGWRIRNTGNCDWTSGFYLAFARGNVPVAQMNGIPVAVTGNIRPGQEIDLYVNLIAPAYPGTYQGFWQMVAPNGKPFGQTVWVGITVPGAEPTPLPDEPVIENLAASPGSITTGSCTSVAWRVTGAITQVELKRGNDILWSNAPNSGTYDDCINTAGTYTYRLTVNGPGGSTARTANVVVSNPPPPASPVIYTFGIRPREINLGACATVQWKTGNADTVELYRGDQLINRLGAEGSFQDCPDTGGNITYRLVARNNNGTVESTYNLFVMGGVRPSPR